MVPVARNGAVLAAVGIAGVVIDSAKRSATHVAVV
jgi:hypothetical protein